MLFYKKIIICIIIIVSSILLWNLFKKRKEIEKSYQVYLSTKEGLTGGGGGGKITDKCIIKKPTTPGDKEYTTLTTPIQSEFTNNPYCTKIKNVNIDYYSLPLHQFCIKSSYNSVVTGKYTHIEMICFLLNCGVRYFDFEILLKQDEMDSKKWRPIITYTSDPHYRIVETVDYVLLDDVLKTLNEKAFSSKTAPNAEDPLFLFFRIKPNDTNDPATSIIYKTVAESIESKLKNSGRLYTEVLSYHTLLRPLIGKIVILVDGYPNSFIIEDWYRYQNGDRKKKSYIHSKSNYITSTPGENEYTTSSVAGVKHYTTSRQGEKEYTTSSVAGENEYITSIGGIRRYATPTKGEDAVGAFVDINNSLVGRLSVKANEYKSSSPNINGFDDIKVITTSNNQKPSIITNSIHSKDNLDKADSNLASNAASQVALHSEYHSNVEIQSNYNSNTGKLLPYINGMTGTDFVMQDIYRSILHTIPSTSFQIKLSKNCKSHLCTNIETIQICIQDSPSYKDEHKDYYPLITTYKIQITPHKFYTLDDNLSKYIKMFEDNRSAFVPMFVCKNYINSTHV